MRNIRRQSNVGILNYIRKKTTKENQKKKNILCNTRYLKTYIWNNVVFNYLYYEFILGAKQLFNHCFC